MARLEANTVKGLILSLDRRKITPPQVLDGRNFFVDIDGPRSGFSRFEIVHGLIDDPYFAESFKTDADTDSWIFTRSAIIKFDWATGKFIPVFTYTQASAEFPWSRALVGGKHYFAKREVGLIQYDPVADTWTAITGGSVPVGIVGCCEAGARLIVQATGIVAWSAIDDGTDFVPSTATGVGFQTLGLVGSFTAASLLGVYRTADGFIAYTKNGLMKGEVMTSLSPFRVKRMTFDHIPFNAFCITYISDDEHVFLTNHGLYITRGQTPTEWQPLMSEYLRQQVLPQIADVDLAILRLQYFSDSQWFFVSISESQTPSLYSKAFVYSKRSDEWGSFNHVHTAMMEIWISDGAYKGLNFGYMDSNGNAYKFTYDSVDLLFPSLTWYNEVYAPPPLFPARVELGIGAMPAVGHISSVDESIFPAPGVFNLYAEKEDADSPALATLATSSGLPVTAEYVNLLAASSDFANAAWNDKVRISVVSDATADPDGGSAADKLVLDLTNNVQHYAGQGAISIGPLADVQFICFFKAAEMSWAALQINNSEGYSGAVFDLSGAGNIGLVYGIPDLPVQYGITAYPDGWYLCGIRAKCGTTGQFTAYVVMAEGFSDTIIDVGDGVSGIYAYKANAYYPLYDGVNSFASQINTAAGIVQLYVQYQPYTEGGLDSFIEVGLFRLFSQEGGRDVLEMSCITDVAIGMLGTATTGIEYEDYIRDYSTDIVFDWMTETGYEDWGLGSASGNIYTSEIRASFDGFETLEDQQSDLELTHTAGKTSQYSGFSTGVYHSIFVRAENPGESYHLKALELSGISAGRIV